MKLAKRFLTGIFTFLLMVSLMIPFEATKAHAEAGKEADQYIPSETYLTDVKTDLPDGVYSMPVRLHHAYQKQLSMGNNSIDGNILVQKDGDKYTYYLRMRGLKFMGLFGHLWNVQAPEKKQVDNIAQYNPEINYENQKNFKMSVSKTFMDTDLEKKEREFPRIIMFEGDKALNQIVITIWVDAMDAIASGGATEYGKIVKGKGEQRGIVQIDWHNPISKATAKEISDYGVVLPPADKTKLEYAIVAAEKAKEGIEVSTDGTDKDKTVKWVTEAEMKTFNDAINAAETVRKEELTKIQQEKVDNAVKTLNAAKDKFETAKKNGTKVEAPKYADLTELNKAVERAKAAVKNIKTSKDGKDIAKTDKWVTAEVMKAITDKTSEAEKLALSKPTADRKADVEKMTGELNSMIGKFKPAEGTKVEVVISKPDTGNEDKSTEMKGLTPPSKMPVKPNALKKPVKTGDNSMPLGYAVLAVILVGTIYYVVKRKNAK